MSRKHSLERVRRRKAGYFSFSSQFTAFHPYATFSRRRRRKAASANEKRFWDQFFVCGED